MKKFLTFILSMLMVLSVFPLAACSQNKDDGQSDLKAPKGTVTRMTVDINPSIEFMVNDENKVVSVTALNDDASILIAGEAFVGKTPEEATQLVISLATDTGYLVKGEAEVSENKVKISVSGDTEYAKELAKNIEKSANDLFAKLDIKGKVEKVEALKLDALRKLAMDTGIFDEEYINSLDEKALYETIAAGRIETALLLTEDMRNAYFTAKDYEISFAEREETAKIIEKMGGAYILVHKAYKAALDSYSKMITDLENLRYKTFIAEDSDYQKALAKLRDAKTELLKQRNIVASIEVDGEVLAKAELNLKVSEEAYDAAVKAFEKVAEMAKTALDKIIAGMKECEKSLIKIEESFDDNIKETLANNAKDIEAKLNTAKDNFFENFEKEHKDDILSMEQALKDKKQQLIDNVKNAKAPEETK